MYQLNIHILAQRLVLSTIWTKSKQFVDVYRKDPKFCNKNLLNSTANGWSEVHEGLICLFYSLYYNQLMHVYVLLNCVNILKH